MLVPGLRNERVDVTAHDTTRRQQADTEGIERLSAEYLTIAAAVQVDRWDGVFVRSGLSDVGLHTVPASEAHGPLVAALRDAESCGLNVETAFPRLIASSAPAARHALGSGTTMKGMAPSRVLARHPRQLWSINAGHRRQVELGKRSPTANIAIFSLLG